MVPRVVMLALLFLFATGDEAASEAGAGGETAKKKRSQKLPTSPMDFLPPDVAAKIMGIKDAAFEQGNGPEGFIENCQAFGAAVDWTETWIQCLMGFHVILLVLILITREMFELQCFFFMLICGLVFFAERLNSYASAHWEEFSKQDYFDKRGVFLSVMLCAPLLVNGFVLMIRTLLYSADLLVKVKRAELKQKMESDKSESSASKPQKAGKGNKKGKKKDE